MCRKINCLECPSFDGSCKLLKARIMKVFYVKFLFKRFKYNVKKKLIVKVSQAKFLFRRFKDNTKKKLKIIETYLYNLKIDLFTVFYNITLDIKTYIKKSLKTIIFSHFTLFNL